MKICVPTQSREGLKAAIYGHFGSASFFTICDTETGKCGIIDNGDMNHQHGMCNPLKAVGEARPDAVITGGIGAGAIRGLQAAGIKVYIAQGGTVEEAIASLKEGKLTEADPANACSHHGGHGCH